MGNYSKELQRAGIIEAKAGSKSTTRRYLDRTIHMANSWLKPRYDILKISVFRLIDRDFGGLDAIMLYRIHSV